MPSAVLTVTGTSAAKTAYPVRVDVTWQSGMKADFADVRFADTGGSLNYWRESYTSSTSAKFWVVMNTPASGSSKQVTMSWDGSASYAGLTWGGNALFGSYDGGSGSPALTRASGKFAGIGSSGAWNDRYVFDGHFVRNRDGTLYRDGSGYAYMLYMGANVRHGEELQGPGDDRPGMYRTQDFSTWEHLTPTAPFLTWDAGTWMPSPYAYTDWFGTFHPASGGAYDGRVIQPQTIIRDTDGTFYMFYDGDRGPFGSSIYPGGGAAEHYSVSVATTTSLTGGGTWTKYASNPVFPSASPPYTMTNSMVAYAGDVIYDEDETDSNKRWKMYFQGLNIASNKSGMLLATAPAPTGPWTRYNSNNYVFEYPSAAGDKYNGGTTRVFKLRGIWYCLWESYGSNGYAWATHLALSYDGISWTNRGEIFRQGSGWDSNRMYWMDVLYDEVAARWRFEYTGAASGGSYSSNGLFVPADIGFGMGTFTANPPPGSWDPTVVVGATAAGFGNNVSAGYGDATAYAPPPGSLTIDAASTAWEQIDTSIIVRVTADGPASVPAVVTSTHGGLVRFRGTDADLFEVSLDGTTWASTVDVPIGETDVFLRVTPETPGTTLSAEIGVPV